MGFCLRKPRPEIAHADAGRQGTLKKTPNPDGRSGNGVVGPGRGAFSAARLALPDVDSAGGQGPGLAPLSDPETDRLLWRSSSLRRPTPLPPGTGRFNAKTCWDLLRSLRRACRNSKKRVVVILDNAKFHHALLHKAWLAKVAPGFELDFLPPYSPELNPIERVRELTRRSCLQNLYFEKLSELIHDVECQFDAWRRGDSTLHRLCARI
ncbi:MAG: transposase [Paludibaculum sp.]